MRSHFPDVILKASRLLHRLGYVVVEDESLDALSLPWIENRCGAMHDVLWSGLFSRFESSIEATGSVPLIVTLDPYMAISSRRHTKLTSSGEPIVRWICDLPDVVQELLPREPAVVDRHPLFPDLTQALAFGNTLLPDGLLAAGAPVILNADASALLWTLVQRKQSYLEEAGRSLLTLDAVSLLRYPTAMTPFDGEV